MLNKKLELLLAFLAMIAGATFLVFTINDVFFTEDDGVEMITIDGGHQVWTQKVGDNPSVKILLLHGGTGATHENFKNIDD